MKKWLLTAAFGGTLLGFTAPALAQRAIVHDNPWGQGATIDAAANDVFGTGNWNRYGYSGLSAAALFSDTNRFVYLEGGDGTTSVFESFVNSSATAMEAWVRQGGRLFLNAARWNGTNPLNYVFGASLNVGYSGSGAAMDPSHRLFTNMGYGNTGTAWTGSYFSHDYITGAGLTGLIRDANGRMILAEQRYGDGFVVYGGITTNNFHGPQAEARALTRNTLAYVDGFQAPTTTVTPEPVSMALLGTGLAGVAGAARRRRRKQEEEANA